MTQVPILSGIYSKTASDFERSVPTNLTPIAEPGDGTGSGISKGYLQTIPGIATAHSVEGQDRGATLYAGQHLRVIGTALYEITSTGPRQIGQVGAGGPVQFAEGFGRLGIASAGGLYYYDGTTLSQVTDEDLRKVLSVTWSDSYFLTTDGEFLVATDLNDNTSVSPLRYGSSEADPDSIIGVLAQRGEVYAVNRYTIEKFVNAGTTGFPFQRSRGSQIGRGCVGSAAYTPFLETFAFCGSARNETPGIYVAGSGEAEKISPRIVDQALAALSLEQLATVELETVNAAGLYQLLVHLPQETWVYHHTASQVLGVPVWSRLAGGPVCDQAWPARHYLQVGDAWFCGGIGKVGRLDDTIGTLFGERAGFLFDTPLIYNGGRGASVHAMELVYRGKAAVALSYTDDGRTWSQERFCDARRLAWRRLGRVRNYRGFRFRGILSGQASFARLEAEMEPLGA